MATDRGQHDLGWKMRLADKRNEQSHEKPFSYAKARKTPKKDIF
jgi:hypothetical protein